MNAGLLLRDQAVIELLRHDLDELGEGVPLTTIAEASQTRWPWRVIDRLRREGLVIEQVEDRFKLWEEPESTGASDRGAPASFPAGTGSDAPVGSGQSELFDETEAR